MFTEKPSKIYKATRLRLQKTKIKTNLFDVSIEKNKKYRFYAQKIWNFDNARWQ